MKRHFYGPWIRKSVSQIYSAPYMSRPTHQKIVINGLGLRLGQPGRKHRNLPTSRAVYRDLGMATIENLLPSF